MQIPYQPTMNRQHFSKSVPQNLRRRGNTKQRRSSKRKRIERAGREEKHYLLHTFPCARHFYCILRTTCSLFWDRCVAGEETWGAERIRKLPEVTQLTGTEGGVKFRTPSSPQPRASSPARVGTISIRGDGLSQSIPAVNKGQQIHTGILPPGLLRHTCLLHWSDFLLAEHCKYKLMRAGELISRACSPASFGCTRNGRGRERRKWYVTGNTCTGPTPAMAGHSGSSHCTPFILFNFHSISWMAVIPIAHLQELRSKEVKWFFQVSHWWSRNLNPSPPDGLQTFMVSFTSGS